MVENSNDKVWLIRHACSKFNLWDKWKRGIIKDSELEQDELAFVKSIKYQFDLKFMDANITHLGQAQATAAQSKVASIPLKYVITSPLKRALETTKVMLSTHPLKSEIKIIVHPLIRECMKIPDDIPNWTLKTWKEEYAVKSGLNFDFGMIEKMNSVLYFLESIEPEIKEEAINRIKIVGEDKYPEVMAAMMEEKWYKASKHYRHLESHLNVRRRARLFLKWLKEFIEEKKVKSSEVAVVAHATLIQCMAAKDFNEYKKPIYPFKENAVPFQLDINEILKYP